MKLFSLNTELHHCDSLKSFFESFEIGSHDLILTSRGMFTRSIETINPGCRVIFHDDYGKGEPSDAKIDALLCDAAKSPFNRLIAIGGGTVLDIAKILVLENITQAESAFMRKQDLIKAHDLICVPTTCGTGSEVTNISIMELRSKSSKVGLADPVLMPDHAVLIPELLKDLPYGNYLFSSVDALIHAVESFVSPKANGFTKTLSLEAATIIIETYKQLLEDGPDVRHEHHADMLLASTMAGVAFGNAGVGAVHALSYPLGGTYHVPHGEANYQFFMAVFNMYQRKNPEGGIKVLEAALAEILDCEPEHAFSQLEQLLNELITRKPLSEYGMTKAQIDDWTESVITSQQRLLQNNYTELSSDDIKSIYQALHS